VTVCIAAICEDRRIVGASDRMITANDVEFEPEQPKIWPLTSSIVALYSGDSALQTEILERVESDVASQIAKDPATWLTVRHVADLYSRYYQATLRKRAETDYLSPFGLDGDSFIRRQREMDPQLVGRLASRLIEYKFQPQAAILTGVDLDGPQTTGTQPDTYAHIYVARDADITCHDRVGFAAIGIGQSHAESQFMFAGHTRAKPFPETVLLTYSAKKRAEVAPGVGSDTDMFAIGAALGSYFTFGDHVIAGLKDIDKKTNEEMKLAAGNAQERMKAFDAELAQKAKAREEQTRLASETTPSSAQKSEGQ